MVHRHGWLRGSGGAAGEGEAPGTAGAAGSRHPPSTDLNADTLSPLNHVIDEDPSTFDKVALLSFRPGFKVRDDLTVQKAQAD
jgi:hypothetical protein